MRIFLQQFQIRSTAPFLLFTPTTKGTIRSPTPGFLDARCPNLDQVPAGLVAKVIPESQYAVFTTQGEFPQGLIAVWQAIWNSAVRRSFTSDFELYQADFHPQKNPEVKVYIAIDLRGVALLKRSTENIYSR